ncbi:Response regulator protein VraR [compost metagenome]
MASREDGLDAAEALRAQLPSTAVVLLTTFGEDAYVDRALRVGVAGFLLKSGDPAALTDGLAAAAAGGACLSPFVAARLIRHLAGGLGARPVDRPAVLDSLTPRERDVLVAIARGLSNAEVAATLHLTEGTVKGYVSALFDRLGVRNRVEAAVLAHTAGLVPRG